LNDDLLNDFLLEAFPNPERKGCPEEKTLRAFAEDRLPAGHPILQHVASCSECYAEYRHYRQDWKELSGESAHSGTLAPRNEPDPLVPKRPVASTQAARSKVLPWAVAAALLLVAGSGLYFVKERHSPGSAGALVASSAGPVAANVDLFNAVTVRGGGNGDEPMPLKEVSVPSSVVQLNVTLPRFSESGPYRIVVAKDRAGTDIVARGIGDAVDVQGKVSVVVTLDLRNAAPGMYFLATVRGSDNGTYYYPLKVN
jgi:hypothetical protein